MEKIGSKLTDLKDIELIELALQDNSQEAFSILHNRYQQGLKLYINRYVQAKEDIEDICIISFQKAFNQLSTFNKNNKFSTWLYTIARNTAFDHQNKEIVRGKLERQDISNDKGMTLEIVDDSISPEDDIINLQDHELLIKSIEGLPDLYRDVAQKCFIENLGYKEISQSLNIPLNTIKTRISRAKTMLIKSMKNIEE